MPAKTEKQRKFMVAELQRKREGMLGVSSAGIDVDYERSPKPLDDLAGRHDDIVPEAAGENRRVAHVAFVGERLHANLTVIEAERLNQVASCRSRRSIVGERCSQDSHDRLVGHGPLVYRTSICPIRSHMNQSRQAVAVADTLQRAA